MNIYRLHLSFPNRSEEEQNMILDKISDFLDSTITTDWCGYSQVDEYDSEQEMFENAMRSKKVTAVHDIR